MRCEIIGENVIKTVPLMPQSDTNPMPRTRGEMDGTKPITDRDSKMVMLRAERSDQLKITRVISEFETATTIPDEFEVQQRVSTYYGTELLLESTASENREKYLLTAPGPDTFLYLWASRTDSDGFREGWSVVSEIKAKFSDEMPQYSICDNCGEPIKSLEHEKLAVMDSCPGK